MVNADEIYPSRWLKAEDVGEEKIKVTIKEIKVEEFGEGDKTQKKIVLEFDESDKGLVLNKTNKDRLKEAWGNETDNWIGHAIQLYTVVVSFGNKEMNAIRLKTIGGGDPTA